MKNNLINPYRTLYTPSHPRAETNTSGEPIPELPASAKTSTNLRVSLLQGAWRLRGIGLRMYVQDVGLGFGIQGVGFSGQKATAFPGFGVSGCGVWGSAFRI